MKNHRFFKSKFFIFLAFFTTSFIVTSVLLFVFFKKPILLKIPVQAHLESSLNKNEETLISKVLSEDNLYHEMNISAEYSFIRPSEPNSIISDILVPTTHISGSNISKSDLKNLLIRHNNSSLEYLSPDVTHILTPILDVKPAQSIVAVDGDFFLENFNSGAVFRVIKLSGDPEETSNLREKILANLPTFPDKNSVLSFAQTGVTALTRAMTTKLNQIQNPLYFSAHIKDFLKSKDITHISNEVSFAENCSGGRATTTLCADWKMLDTILDIGTDIVELTGNHNNDYGAAANLKTIEKYEELDLKTFGGGKNLESASTPLKIHQKNQNITLIGINHSTSSVLNGQGASQNHPGANIYNPELLKSQIDTAKNNKDFIIVDVQFFECYAYPDSYREFPHCDAPITGQQDFFRQIIDLGADIVVGTSAHQPQTFEAYKHGTIYYGLGNLFFDQTYWPDTRKSLILTHYFWNNKLLTTKISPTIYDESYQTKLMDEKSASEYLTRLRKSTPTQH